MRRFVLPLLADLPFPFAEAEDFEPDPFGLDERFDALVFEEAALEDLAALALETGDLRDFPFFAPRDLDCSALACRTNARTNSSLRIACHLGTPRRLAIWAKSFCL